MLSIINVKESGYEEVAQEAAASGVLPVEQVVSPTGSCTACAMYSPSPQFSGNLQVDPEIVLPSPGMNVEIAYFYNSFSPVNGAYGYGRTLSTNLTAQASGAPAIVSMTRGNGAVVTYQADGGGFISHTPENLNTLEQDFLNNQWKETTPQGQAMAYPLDTNGAVTSISYAQDAVGNRHSFTYSNGLLQTLQDSVGRFVSFSYEGSGLLEEIQDWAGRRTTFQYDSASIPGKPVLTTVIGPSGCQTGYASVADANGIPRLTQVTDPNGYATTYDYDQAGRVTQRTLVSEGSTTSYNYQAGSTAVIQPNGGILTHSLDAQWRPTEIVSADGVTVSFTRNSREQETMRQNALGAVATTVYDSAGLPIANVNALGHTTSFTRDAYGNVTKTQFADGTITTTIYGYAGSSFDTTGAKRRLQVQVDPLGNRISYSYNGRGQLRSMQDPLGYRTTYGYDSLGNNTTVTDALGYVTTLTYDLAGNVIATTDALGHTTTIGYDAQNRPVEVTNALGYTNTTAYDSVGNPIVTIDPLGRRTSYSYNGFNKLQTTTDMQGGQTVNVYDVQGRVIATQDALGYRNTIVYDLDDRVLATIDALGYRTSSIYDQTGRQIATIDALGYRTSTSYDLDGIPIASMDALGYVTTTVYDVLDRPVATIDALGRRSTTVYDKAGRAIADIDVLGYRSTTVYDQASRPIANIDALGQINTTSYDALGRTIASQDALGYRSTLTYDAIGRQVALQNARGFVTTNVYDTVNRLQSTQTPLGMVTSYLYNAADERIALQDALGYLHTSVYDSLGRLQSSIDPLGHTSQWVYDAAGQLIQSIDANTNSTYNSYDGNGQVKNETDARGFRTSFLYDAVGQQIAIVNAKSHLTTSVYDARGSLLAGINPLGQRTSTTYDAVGNPTRRIDARGIVTSYSYDAVDRLTGTLYPDSGRITYAYDALGRQTAMIDQDAQTNYEYDAGGRLTWVAYPIGQSLSYSYDAVGNRTGMGSAQGVTAYDYDAQDRLTAITNPYSQTTEMHYDALDREVRKELANGVVVSHTYDMAGRETVLEQRQSSGVAIAVYTATYDNVGNRTGVQELDGATMAYSYDETYQLLSETRSGSNAFSTAFTYDGLGNRLTETKDSVVTSYTYDANNAVTTATTGGAVTTYSYDQNGNRIGIDDGTVTTYSWDTENRMIGVTNPDSSTESFAYSGDGQRRRKTTDTEDILYLWDEENVLAELNGNGGLIAQYTDNPGYWGGLSSLHLEGGSSAFIAPAGGMGAFNTVEFDQWGFNQEQSSGGSGDYYYLFDQNASTRYLVDGGGEVTDSELYRAFGERVTSIGHTRNPYRFQGEVGPYADAANRVWMRARIYGPMAGQWYSTDPIGFAGGDWNLHRFVGNNPTNNKDPEGLMNIIWIGLGLGIVVGTGAIVYKVGEKIYNASCYKREEGRCFDLLWSTRQKIVSHYGCFIGQGTSHGDHQSRCNDDFAHCVHHCLLTARYGVESSLFCRERRGDDRQERKADDRGVYCARQGRRTFKSCNSCCQRWYTPLLPDS